jgi:hypothetical protein
MQYCMYFLTAACRNSSFASAVRMAGGLEILSPFLATTGVEKLQTAFLMAFVVGREETLSSGVSLLSMFPDLVDLLLEIFALTLDCRGRDDYVFGIFDIPLIVAALLALGIADANKAKLVEAPLLPLLIRILELYRNDAPAIEKYVCLREIVLFCMSDCLGAYPCFIFHCQYYTSVFILLRVLFSGFSFLLTAIWARWKAGATT